MAAHQAPPSLGFSRHSDQISRSVVSDSLRPHESQHARPPCPSPTPRAHSDSRPSSQWCHLAISSSVVPFSSCSQTLPASESFPMSQLFAWGGQRTGVWHYTPTYKKCMHACFRSCATMFLTRLFKIALRWKQWNVYLGGMKTSTVVPPFHVM